MAKVTKLNKDSVQKYVAEVGYPEVGSEDIVDQKWLQKFYKHLTDDQLTEWVEIEGLTYTASESAPIERMRKCMAILYKHYPKAPSTKKKSKYSDYSDEMLMQLLLDNDVPCEVTEDERIMRMRAIMALRAHKVIE
jgi:hypothetical protein